MKIYGFIFARSGSKGIKNKNIKKFVNKPLIEHTFEFANRTKIFDKIFISSDSEKIRNLGKKYGIFPILRPRSLAQDNSNEWQSWEHAINILKKKNDNFDIFVSMPCTSPIKIKKDITSAISKLNKKVDIVLTASETTRHPKFNMIKLNKFGYANIYQKTKKKYFRRQDLDKIYNLTTIAYVCRPEYILNNTNIFDGKVKINVIPEFRSTDIDNLFDFKIAEYLFKKFKNQWKKK